MDEIQIKLSALWVCLMLTYFLGDVIRIFSGGFTAGEIGGKEVSPWMFLGIAAFMVIPIIMVFLTLILKQPVNRWANIVVAVAFFIFNLLGFPSYEIFDKFLLLVSFGFNALTVWYAWGWV